MSTFDVNYHVSGNARVTIPDDVVEEIDVDRSTLERMAQDAAVVRTLIPDNVYERLKREGETELLGGLGEKYSKVVDSIEIHEVEVTSGTGKLFSANYDNM